MKITRVIIVVMSDSITMIRREERTQIVLYAFKLIQLTIKYQSFKHLGYH